MGGTHNSTTQPQSRQCRDEVSRKRFSALGKSRVEMLPSLPFFQTSLLLLSQTAASLERVPRGLYPITFLVSDQPLYQQNLRDKTTNRPQSRLEFAQEHKLGREEPSPSWTKRGIDDLNDKPLPWSPRQSAKQPDRPPFFLPTPQLTSHPLTPILGRDHFHLLSPHPPTSSLRRALRWPPWPPDPHRWGYAEGWPLGLEQILANRALARMELRLSGSYPKSSQRATIDQSPEQVGRPPPTEPPPSSRETRTQWQNEALSACDVAWWRACFTPLNATPFAELAHGRLAGQKFK